MRFLLIVLLFLVFGYSLVLVLANNIDAKVNLVFTQVPAMNLGLLLIITLAIGVVMGLLLGIQVFKVFQTRWEISSLKKELDTLRNNQLKHAASAALAAQQASPVSSPTVSSSAVNDSLTKRP